VEMAPSLTCQELSSATGVQDDTAARASHRSVTRVEQDLAERTVERRPGRRLMAETLEQGLSRLRGRPVRIREIRAILAVELEFPNGAPARRARRRQPLRVFFKDLNPEHQMDKARTVRRSSPSRPAIGNCRCINPSSHQRTSERSSLRVALGRSRSLLIFLEDGGRTLLRSFATWNAGRWRPDGRRAFTQRPAICRRPRPAFFPATTTRITASAPSAVRQILPNLESRRASARQPGTRLPTPSASTGWAPGRADGDPRAKFFGPNIMLPHRTRGPRGCRDRLGNGGRWVRAASIW